MDRAETVKAAPAEEPGVPAGAREIMFEASPIRDDAATLRDRVAIELGARIVRGDLAASSRLPTEAELCDLYGVSRSVIREAIRTLAGRGLVDVRQGHGMQISQPSDAPFAEALIVLLMRSGLAIADIREARAVLETELAPLAAARGEERDWEALEKCLVDYGQAVAASDWSAAQDAHLQFHYCLFEAVHQPALRIILSPMQEIILLSSVPPGVDHSALSKVWTRDDVKLHYPILESLRKRDGEGARRAMETHFAASLKRQEDRFASYWTLPFRESPIAQTLLNDLLTAKK